MKLFSASGLIAAGAICMACATTPSSSPSGDIIQPSLPDKPVEREVKESPKDASIWSLPKLSGEFVYNLETNAKVALVDSTTTLQDVTAKNTYDFRAIPASSERIKVMVQDTGVSVIEPSEPENRSCSDLRSTIIRAKNIIPVIPQDIISTIKVGTTWSESITTEYCRGSIPLKTDVERKYVVLGDTTYSDKSRLLRISKLEEIKSSGNGNEGQHKVTVTINGNSLSTLYLDPTTGRIEKIDGQQTSLVSIFSSGRKSTFAQKVSEKITLIH